MPDPQELAPWVGLAALVDEVGSRRLWALVERAGGARAAWEADASFLAAAGFPPHVAERFRFAQRGVDIDRLLATIDRNRITAIPRSDPRYPAPLAQIADPPLVLFLRGDAALLHERAVAIVGTRTATPYGLAATAALVEPLARSGFVITSGLAYGIDAAAHEACLHADGRTIAVLGTGADDARIYPAAHRALARRILEHRGCIVSEYAPGTDGRPMHFPARNRIVAGLTLATIVVEAPADSGALITAQFALDLGREVFAVPGPITSPMSAGTNALLKSGANPATSALDILDVLHLDELLPPPRTATVQYDGVAGAIIGHLRGDPVRVDDFRNVLHLPASELAVALTTLELDGAIRDVGGGRYIRVP